MERKKVIIWLDDDAFMYRLFLNEVEKSGFEVRKVSQLRKSFSIAKDHKFFTDCTLIIMEPIHFFGMAGRPTPKSLIHYIRHYAKCDAPIMFFTLSCQDKKEILQEYKDYGVVKILSKLDTLPSHIKSEIQEILA